jgi:hypothetical protein
VVNPELGIGLLGALGTFAFFGGIALLMWIDSRNKRHERELRHAERIKALELGQSLPDGEVARAHADQARAWVLGLICFIVPPCLVGTAVGATALILDMAAPGIHLALLCVIWGIAGLVSLVTVTSSLHAISGARDDEEKKKDEVHAEVNVAHRIKEPSARL